MRRVEILSGMRIVIAIFGFVSLAAAVFVAMPAKFGSETMLLDQDHIDREPHSLTEVIYSFLPKGDRLAPPRSEEEIEPEIEAEVAEMRQPEGPPLPPPDLPIETLCHTLASVAQANGLPTGFFARLIWQESKLNQRVVSHAGAQGVAQFMPAVAAERGLLNPFDPLAALPHSARFLKEHVEYFGNLGLAAAAYNAGARRVTDWLAKRGRLPEETRQYVKKITGHEPERWTVSNEIDMPVALPKQNPCDGVADLSREAEPAKVAVQLEPPVQRIIEAARIAAAKAAEARAKKLASLKSKRGRLLAKLPGGKRKAKAVAEKSADKPKGNAGKLPPKIADRVTDKPKAGLRLAETTARR
jgi:soluble lytic murein transglycosylase-like protein